MTLTGFKLNGIFSDDPKDQAEWEKPVDSYPRMTEDDFEDEDEDDELDTEDEDEDEDEDFDDGDEFDSDDDDFDELD